MQQNKKMIVQRKDRQNILQTVFHWDSQDRHLYDNNVARDQFKGYELRTMERKQIRIKSDNTAQIETDRMFH